MTLAALPSLTNEPYRLGRFDGPHTTIGTMAQMIKGPRGERSLTVYRLTEHCVRYLQGKDYLSELIAIRNFAAEHCRYKNDPLSTEWVSDPQRVAEEILRYGRATVDCFPSDTLVLGEGMRLRKIQELAPGDKIWGLDRWSTVEGIAYKGVLPVDVIKLNNGSQVPLTPDHQVYVMDCATHGADVLGTHRGRRLCGSTCRRVEKRIRVAELQPGTAMVAPERLPFGTEGGDPERAYVEGLYVSDGWSDNYRFNISGQDGCPKEEQKREVERICERLGIATTWFRKCIAVRDSEWTMRIHQMGQHAPEKHLLSLNLGEAVAAQTLRGVMADSGRNTSGNGRTFTTTSHELMVQTRVLHKMFGITCGWSYIENHGGLGKNPIWRLNARERHTGKREKRLRVKAMHRAVTEVPCWDIQTDDHRVYLPEHDLTVSNCDDVAGFIATMVRQVGREADLVTVGFGRPGHYSHVFARALESKSGRWIALDPVAGTDEGKMLRRITTYKIWKLD